MQYIKRTLVFVLAAVQLLCLTACHRKGTVGDTKAYSGATLVCAVVPYVQSGHPDFDKVYELERDAYGRAMFSYNCFSSFCQKTLDILVICQTTDPDTPKYYADICYLIHGEDDAEFSDSEIATLKERNDWEKPLNFDKMQTVSENYESDWNQQYDTAKAAVTATLQLDDAWFVSLGSMEYCGDGTWFILTKVAPSENKQENGQLYLALYCPDEEQPIRNIEPFEWTYDCQTLIHKFKYPGAEN